ncbi:MAG: LysE family translocator [Verrucomicrobiota bacterium]
MFGIQRYPSFIAAVLIFQLIPGPGTLAILHATARRGIRAGLGTVLGTLIGDFVYMLAALLGLAAVLQRNPLVFAALQWFGAAYLVWMGIQLCRIAVTKASPDEAILENGWVYFCRGCAVSLTNPKVILFFVAFFPLFLAPDSARVPLVALMVHVTLISFLYQTGLVLIGNSISQKLAKFPRAGLIATRAAGVVLIAFGIRLALSYR